MAGWLLIDHPVLLGMKSVAIFFFVNNKPAIFVFLNPPFKFFRNESQNNFFSKLLCTRFSKQFNYSI